MGKPISLVANSHSWFCFNMQECLVHDSRFDCSKLLVLMFFSACVGCPRGYPQLCINVIDKKSTKPKKSWGPGRYTMYGHPPDTLENWSWVVGRSGNRTLGHESNWHGGRSGNYKDHESLSLRTLNQLTCSLYKNHTRTQDQYGCGPCTPTYPLLFTSQKWWN